MTSKIEIIRGDKLEFDKEEAARAVAGGTLRSQVGYALLGSGLTSMLIGIAEPGMERQAYLKASLAALPPDESELLMLSVAAPHENAHILRASAIVGAPGQGTRHELGRFSLLSVKQAVEGWYTWAAAIQEPAHTFDDLTNVHFIIGVEPDALPEQPNVLPEQHML